MFLKRLLREFGEGLGAGTRCRHVRVTAWGLSVEALRAYPR